ncbi:MAG TPA: DUF4097 family beta strand repeat-containing protein [Terriglobales bacterium]|nr:DUF4097 family beta strand repeat-containing protein [Terriglobales bacterium]
MKRNHTFALLAVMAMAALPLFAQISNSNSRITRDGGGWVEEVTGTIPAPGSLRVNTDTGSIEVQGGSQKDVTYTIRKRVNGGSEENARRDLAGFRIVAMKHGEVAAIEGVNDRHYGRLSVEFHIQVPRELQQVRASTEGGNLNLRNLSGRVTAQSGGGNITLAGLGGEVTANTGGGSIDVADVTNTLTVNTGGGNIKINGSKGKVSASTGGGWIALTGASDAVKLTTGGGNVKVQQCGSELHVTTGGGSIEVGEVSGNARMETGGGSIRLTSARGPVIANTGGGSIELYKLMQGARAETGAGPITAEFLGIGTDSTLQTSVGDVIVYLGPQAKVTVKAELDMANGHKIRSDFPDLKITTDGAEYGPTNYYAQGSLNGGGPVLRVRTMSGNIEFRRAR